MQNTVPDIDSASLATPAGIPVPEMVLFVIFASVFGWWVFSRLINPNKW